MVIRAVVLADTHLLTSPRPRGRLPESAIAHLRKADLILHAGDLLDVGVLEMLGEMAPVHAVLGNNDISLEGVLPPTMSLEIAGVTVGMVHDSGARAGRAARMQRRFPNADVVVFGHSHTPANELGDSGQLLFNPGSPTQRRAQPRHTLGVLCLANSTIVERAIYELD